MTLDPNTSKVSFPYDDDRMEFYCPGCGAFHWVHLLNPTKDYKWDMNPVEPTVSGTIRKYRSRGEYICEFDMQNGFLVYSATSTHHKAGMTVKMVTYSKAPLHIPRKAT